jgi:DNA-directed RNA polymerase specialized sigma24 family protein
MEQGERAELRRLMGRLAEGDRAAFGPAFALLWPQVRTFAVRFAGEADGEDAAQAALLKVFAQASAYDPARDPLPWALGIAAWECRTLRRSRARRKELLVPGASAGPARDASAAPSPEEAAIERDLLAAAEAVLGSLRPLDVTTIRSIASGGREASATFRKRVERALSRFRIAWRARHGSD